MAAFRDVSSWLIGKLLSPRYTHRTDRNIFSRRTDCMFRKYNGINSPYLERAVNAPDAAMEAVSSVAPSQETSVETSCV